MKDLSKLNKDAQIEFMEKWFRERYEDPVNCTPRCDGEYIFIHGGPFDAHEVLSEEFEPEVPEAVIEELANSLSWENAEWAPIDWDDDYDQALYNVVSSNQNALLTFQEGVNNIHALRDQLSSIPNSEMAYSLLFSNVITVLETYLSDTFINRVLSSPKLIRRFIETTPDFKKRSITFSKVLTEAEKVPEKVKSHLLDVVWHNLGRVEAMYRHTLGIDFRKSIKNVGPAIVKRHDIVHRNGKKKDGSYVVIDKKELEEIIKDVTSLVHVIEEQFNEESDSSTKEDAA